MVITTPTASTSIVVSMATIEGNQMATATLPTGTGATYYWQTLQGLSGNLIALYGNTITFNVFHTAADATSRLITPNVLLISPRGTIQINMLGVPFNQTTQMNVTIEEPVVTDRAKLILILSNLQMVLISASYSSSPKLTA